MFVYITRCCDGTLYVGWAVNLERRIKAHNSGRGAKYTASRRPVVLVWWEKASTKSLAMKREAEIKKYSRAQKLALISKGYDGKDDW